jgi:hypothetical protein
MGPAFAELPRVCEAASLADVLHDQLDYLLASAEHPLANDADRARLARVRLILMAIFDDPATVLFQSTPHLHVAKTTL